MNEAEVKRMMEAFEEGYHPAKVKRNEENTKYLYYQVEMEFQSFAKGWKAHSKFLATEIVKASEGRPNSAGYSYSVADTANNETLRPD